MLGINNRGIGALGGGIEAHVPRKKTSEKRVWLSHIRTHKHTRKQTIAHPMGCLRVIGEWRDIGIHCPMAYDI